MTRQTTLPPRQLTRQSGGRRPRLLASVALYGGALGAAALLISLMARMQYRPPLYEPAHLATLPSVFLSGAGLLAGALVAGLLTYWTVKRAENASSPLIWVALGLVYGMVLPFVTGALAPVSLIFLDLAVTGSAADEVMSGLVDSAFRSPYFAFVYGAMSLQSAALAAPVFAAGAWFIDRANASDNLRVSRVGAYTIALGLSLGIIAMAFFGPPSALAKLG